MLLADTSLVGPQKPTLQQGDDPMDSGHQFMRLLAAVPQDRHSVPVPQAGQAP